MTRSWFIAECHDCDPVLPQPFRDEEARNAWADESISAGYIPGSHGVRVTASVETTAARTGTWEGDRVRRCGLNGCTRLNYRRGMCAKHYGAWRESRPNRPRCLIAGCLKAACARDYCLHHYETWRRAQDRQRMREIHRLRVRRRRGLTRDVYRCEDCAGSFAVTEGGSLYVHRRVDGSRCPGSGRLGLRLVAAS